MIWYRFLACPYRSFMDNTPQYINPIDDLNAAVDNPSSWLVDAFTVARSEGTVNVEGCDIQFYQWGDSSKPSIVMMHGFLAHSGCWAFVAPFLTKNYHVVAFDFSGMGDSGWRDRYSDELRVKELMAVCDTTGLLDQANKPIVIAHSYGGRIAHQAVNAHVGKFDGMIICDLMIIRPSILLANADKFAPPGNRSSSKPNRIYPDYNSAKQRFVLAPPQQVQNSELFDFMAFHSLKEVDGGWQWKFDPKVFKREENLKHAVTEEGKWIVKTPGRKAMIYGVQSKLFTKDSVNYMHELIAEAECESFPMIEIPEAEHHLMLDQPIAVTSALRSILAFWNH